MYQFKNEKMIVISTREFRDKQKSYLDKIDEGLEVLIQRGKNKTYKIVPITEDNTVISKEEFNLVLEEGFKDIDQGRTARYTLDEIRKKMGL